VPECSSVPPHPTTPLLGPQRKKLEEVRIAEYKARQQLGRLGKEETGGNVAAPTHPAPAAAEYGEEEGEGKDEEGEEGLGRGAGWGVGRGPAAGIRGIGEGGSSSDSDYG